MRTSREPVLGTASASGLLSRKIKMNIRGSRLAMGALAVATVLLMSARSFAVYYELGPSKNEWGLKYGVDVTEADGDKLNVVFTLADEGRLKPIYSVTAVAFSLETDSQGGRSYDVKSPFELKRTRDGRRVGQVQIRKEFADRAMIRILTLTFDGKPQTAGARYYDIPLKKFMDQGAAAAPQARSSESKLTK
jgi:hypothetical protein